MGNTLFEQGLLLETWKLGKNREKFVKREAMLEMIENWEDSSKP